MPDAFRPTETLTVHNARTALDAGLAAIDAGQAEIDLAGLTTVDSAAVATLLEWKRAARAKGQHLVFRNPPASLVSLANLYDVDQLLDCPHAAAARRS